MNQEIKRKRMEAIEAQTKYNIAKRMNKLEQKKNVKFKIATALTGLILIATLSSCGPDKKEVPNTNVGYTTTNTSSLENAQGEVICAYANSSYGEYSDYMSGADSIKAQEEIETFHNTYFEPLMNSYEYFVSSDEIDKKDDYYNDFISKAKQYEEKISDINPIFSFDNSIYKNAKYIEGQICLPYNGEVNDGVISDEHVIDPETGNIYVPMSDGNNSKTRK